MTVLAKTVAKSVADEFGARLSREFQSWRGRGRGRGRGQQIMMAKPTMAKVTEVSNNDGPATRRSTGG